MDSRVTKVRDLAIRHPYIVSAIPCVLLWIITGGSVNFLNNIGITTAAQMVIYLVLFLCVTAVFVVMAIRRKLNDKISCLIISIGGFLSRAWYAMYSLTNDAYQHDFGNFDYDLHYAVHDNYILYLVKEGHLPDFDFRGLGQFYHPPLHHIISAVACKINSFVFPGREGNYEFLMCISLFYSLAVLILIYRILRYFKIEGKALVFSFMLAAFYPFMIISAGQINNDPLASLLFIAAFYQALLWYRKPGFKKIILIAVFIGCAMMSKISAGLIALPVAFIFLAALIRSRFRSKDLWLQFASFAAIVFPLGLWFPVRNYIRWGIPPTYVFDLGILPKQDLTVFTPLQRLFGFSEVTMSIPFVVFGEDYRDFNTFTILFKSSLFDDFDHHDQSLFILLSTLVFFLGVAVLIMFVVGLVKTVITAVRERSVELTAVLILLVTEFTSAVIFGFKYPLVCSISFRYIFPTVICFTIFAAACFRPSKNQYAMLLQKIASGVVVLFSLASVAFYACEWMGMPFF
ncbi:Dolichyl-phosphate-mannose-protein mannosyltransferase [Ruminococcaceae bacterium YRB3002]|nr:Dolichyl-phosphate-mannose-protein mannosyltransferase [Ruminococcaceae bacterium YRB3002]